MALPYRFRRSITIAIPLFTALLLFGVLKAFFGIEVGTNIAQTGVKVSFVFAVLNLWLWYLIIKHKVP